MLKSDVEKRLVQLSSNTGSCSISRRHNYGSMHHITDREISSAMMDDIQKSIENWEEKDINKQCYDFMLREYFLFSLVGVVSSLYVII